MLKLNNTGIGGAKNNRQKSGRKFIYYNSTYAYLLLSSHSMPSQQLLNVATKSVLTPKQRELNSTQVGQAPAKNGWHFKSRKRSTSSKLRRTEKHRKWYFNQCFHEFYLVMVVKDDWTLTAKTPQRITFTTTNIPHIIALVLLYPSVPITRFWILARSGPFS